MSVKELLNSIEFLNVGEKCREKGPNQKSFHFNSSFEGTFGTKRVSTLFEKYKVSLSDMGVVETQFLLKRNAYLKLLSEKTQKETEAQRTLEDENRELIMLIEECDIFEDTESPPDSCFFAVHKKENKLVSVNLNSIFKNLLAKGLQDFVSETKARTKPVRKIVNPTLPFGLIKRKNSVTLLEGVDNFNVSKNIDWDVFETAPFEDFKFLVDLVEWLIPCPKQRAVVYAWITYADTGRNETVLLLFGEKGVGKSFLFTFMQFIWGYESTYKSKREVLYDKFNSSLFGLKGLIIDEFLMNKASHKAALKDLMNSTLSIEAKGKNIQKNIPNYMNIAAASNEESDIFLEPDERRFNVVDTNESKPPEELTAKCDLLSRDLISGENYTYTFSLLKGFRQFISDNQDPSYKHYKADNSISKTFWTIVDAGLSNAFRFLKMKVSESLVPVKLSELRKSWHKSNSSYRFPTDNAIKRFCLHYRPMGIKQFSFDGVKEEIKYLPKLNLESGLFPNEQDEQEEEKESETNET